MSHILGEKGSRDVSLINFGQIPDTKVDNRSIVRSEIRAEIAALQFASMILTLAYWVLWNQCNGISVAMILIALQHPRVNTGSS